MECLVKSLPGLLEVMLKKDVLVGPDIRRFMANPQLITTIMENNKDLKYKQIVNEILNHFIV